jgi:glyoxylase-like metal-dependent hydrolase (beta-lactamase superfamily II)
VVRHDTLLPPEARQNRLNLQAHAERFRTLFDCVKAKLFDALPDETWVYPGHGGDTILCAERPHLEEWRERGW